MAEPIPPHMEVAPVLFLSDAPSAIQSGRYEVKIRKVRNGYVVQGREEWLVRDAQEFLECLREELGIEFDLPNPPARAPASPPAPTPMIKPTNELKNKGPTRAFKHSVCGHVSSFEAGTCGGCNGHFCSVCYKCKCAT